MFQSPRGDFGFLKAYKIHVVSQMHPFAFQSPRGDFGFLKISSSPSPYRDKHEVFQSPRGDFGFLKVQTGSSKRSLILRLESFNPLAGILVF